MSKYTSTSNFKIESLGVKDIDVYDLGVEDNENFFANDILVHNSNYLNLQDLVIRKFGKDYKKNGISNIEVAKWLLEFIEGDGKTEGLMKNFVDNSCIELKDYMN